MPIPFVDLNQQHAALQPQLLAAIGGVLERTDFVLGGEVGAFEEAFAAYVGAAHCVSVGSGTDALHLILRALDLGPDDEVIAPTNTFIATIQAICLAGARPVLVDCLEDTALIDPAAVARALTPRTRAVLPVHLYGQPADMDAIAAVTPPGVTIVEDAAQAHGARLQGGRACGTLGRAAGFSFYPSKNLGACGDGGAVTTDDPELADRLRLLRNWGSRVKYEHLEKGLNSRLDTVQAAILNVKLPRLDDWNAARARVAGWYAERLADLPGVQPIATAPWTERHVHHLYVVRLERTAPASALRSLSEQGISAGVHYPRPVHLQPAFQDLGHAEGAFPVAERLAREILSLPMFPELTEDQVDQVVQALRACS